MLLGLSVQVAVTHAGTKAWIKEGLGTSFREDLIKLFIIFPFCSFDYRFGIKHKHSVFLQKPSFIVFYYLINLHIVPRWKNKHWVHHPQRIAKLRAFFWCFIPVKGLGLHRSWGVLFLPSCKDQFRSCWSQRLGQWNRLPHVTSTSMSYMVDKQLVTSGTVHVTSAFPYFLNTVGRCTQ